MQIPTLNHSPHIAAPALCLVVKQDTCEKQITAPALNEELQTHRQAWREGGWECAWVEGEKGEDKCVCRSRGEGRGDNTAPGVETSTQQELGVVFC